MAKGKYKRTVIGSLVKSQDPAKPNYLKFRLTTPKGDLLPGGTLTIKDGDILSAESKAFQLKSAENACKDGKISETVLDSIRERLEKQPDFVIAEIIHVTRL